MNNYATMPLADVRVADLQWLTGNWVGSHGEDQIEESWSPLRADTMMGMFRWIHEGRVRFYEFITIEREGMELILRIKHFNPGLLGWEEKNESKEFVLVQLSGHEAVFLQRKVEKSPAPWMIYSLRDQQTLIAYFEFGNETVSEKDMFIYKR
jgi:hypothetical protein